MATETIEKDDIFTFEAESMQEALDKHAECSKSEEYKPISGAKKGDDGKWRFSFTYRDEPDEVEDTTDESNEVETTDPATQNIDTTTSEIAPYSGDRYVPPSESTLKISDTSILEVNEANVRKYLNIPAMVSSEEVMLAIQKCANNRLNPFIGDVYLIPYTDQKSGKVTLTLQTSKDYYLKVANQYPDYIGFEAGIIVQIGDNEFIEREGTMYSGKEKLVGAWCRVKRHGMAPFYQSVSMKEYDQSKNLWKWKPATMIRKVAIAQTFREAFPDYFSGVYEVAEFEQEAD